MKALRYPRQIGGGMAVGLAALVFFLILWFPVLIGQKVLLGGDILYQLLPWSAEPGAHAAANTIASDPIVQGLPWQILVARAFDHGELPLWNPSVSSGVPLLANDQAGVFSPFTWLALPFQPAIGLSIAMLAKLLVAGFGMFFYLRHLKANSTAAAFGGVAFATSSFMVDWLAWPLAGVACFMPWMFGFVEAYLAEGRPWALPGLALAVCAQFLGGHAETSFHVGLAFGLYVLVRWAFSSHRWRPLAGMAAAVVIGTLLAGIQLVPFVDLLRHAQLISVRSAAGVGSLHLDLAAISTWLFPNAVGNPGIDGRGGHLPNFNESTGFAGVAALVLSPVGAWWSWSRERSVAIGLVGMAMIAAGIAYGPLAPIVGLLPGFAVSNNQRVLVVLCFCVAALGGLGLDGLMRSGALLPLKLHARRLLGVGALGLGGVVLVSLLTWRLGAGVDSLLPHLHSYIGFWLLAGLLALVAAAGFVGGGFSGGSRNWAAAGLCGLALVEGSLFAGTYNPRTPLDEVPPRSDAISWLVAHVEGRPIAALGTTMLPESAVLYGLTDVRGYEVLTDTRQRTYWSAADLRYDDSRIVTILNQPGAAWLAAAGVAYVMMPAGQSMTGANIVYRGAGVNIAAVPDPRPFAFAATSVANAGGPDQAAALLAEAPLGPVVIEGCCPDASAAAKVEITRRTAGSVDLDVTALGDATIVVLQSYQAGWEATVDGRPVAILPADVLFQSVVVTGGHHVVSLRYRPASVAIGAAATGAGAAGLIFLCVAVSGWRRLRPDSSTMRPR